MKVGEDMICPVTGEHCDDECCPVGSECNLSGWDDSDFGKDERNAIEIMRDSQRAYERIMSWIGNIIDKEKDKNETK